MRIALFIPCFIDQLFPQTAINMVKILRKVGCEIHYNTAQTCCGQPACNAGYWKEAKAVATKFIADFDHDMPIVCPSGSCAGFVRNQYEKLFENGNAAQKKQVEGIQNRIFEFSEFMVNVLKIEDVGASLEGIATYHDACGALRECGIKDAPRKLLTNVQGLEVQEAVECETCCGFGGSFSVKFETIATAMASQKIDNVLESTEAKYLISTDLSCLMHLDGYIKRKKINIEVKHLADVLASGW